MNAIFRTIFSICIVVSLLCGCSENTQEITGEPKFIKPSSIDLPSFFEFAVCGIPKSIEEMEEPLEKIDKGLLSKKDLDQPLFDLMTYIEIVNKYYLTDSKKINPSTESAFYVEELKDAEKIKKALNDGWLELLDNSYEYYAKSRVKLIENGFIDLEKLDEENKKLLNTFSNFCLEVNK